MKWRWRYGWSLTYPVFRNILGVRVHGRCKVPQKGTLIIASNHMSFFDPPLVGHAAKRECFFLAKEELFFQSKFFRWLITYFNSIPIKRGKAFDTHLFKESARLLKKKQAIILFPEGTRSLKGKFLPFKTGVGMLALRYQAPVMPAYIKNTHRPISEWLSRQSRVEVFFGDLLYPQGSAKSKEDYEKFTRRIESSVHKLADLAWAGDDPKRKVRNVAAPQIL